MTNKNKPKCNEHIKSTRNCRVSSKLSPLKLASGYSLTRLKISRKYGSSNRKAAKRRSQSRLSSVQKRRRHDASGAGQRGLAHQMHVDFARRLSAFVQRTDHQRLTATTIYRHKCKLRTCIDVTDDMYFGPHQLKHSEQNFQCPIMLLYARIMTLTLCQPLAARCGGTHAFSSPPLRVARSI